MHAPSDRKPFTAELQRQRQQQTDPVISVQQLVASLGAALGSDIATLRTEILHLKASLDADKPTRAPTSSQPAAADPVASGEMTVLKTELRALAYCIDQTKMEIASLRSDEDSGQLDNVTLELDAVVTATEDATQRILDATERIDVLARELNAHANNGYAQRLIDDIAENTTLIFEACNFQDITGQRISKVVRTLEYIDGRIAAMINILGIDAMSGLAPRRLDQSQDPEAHLLNGPQLGQNGISQADIDRLFNP
jgi:chemotaxis protein CheZ